MSNSLKDQLIKAGLVTQEQADAADADKRRARRDSGAGRGGGSQGGAGGGSSASSKSAKGRPASQRGKGRPGERSGARRGRGQGAGGASRVGAAGRSVDDSPEAVRARALAQQRGRDQRAVAALRKAAGSTEKALRDEMRRFIALYDQRAKTAADSDEPYNFVHNKKIKRIHVPSAQLDALSVGELVIINNDGRYALLPFAPACTVGELDQRRIVTAHLSGED